MTLLLIFQEASVAAGATSQPGGVRVFDHASHEVNTLDKASHEVRTFDYASHEVFVLDKDGA